MIHISAEQIENANQFSSLVEALKCGFQNALETPMRHHHDFANPVEQKDSTLLLMPSWEAGKNLGVKVVTVSPNNGRYGLPSIQGVYLLFDAHQGQPKALLDGKTLTVKRTAAASALASSYLSKSDSKSLLMVGTGALSTNLIKAHCSQRPIEKVWVWGRSVEKAQAIVDQIKLPNISIEAVENLDQYIPEADIISCATLSPTPLIKGALLREGQHLDLVGSYKKDTREADDDVIKKGSLFVDTFQGGLKESGDVVIPLQTGLISEKDVLADLHLLTKLEHSGRSSENEITVFKSVGHASEDLMAANYFYTKIQQQ